MNSCFPTARRCVMPWQARWTSTSMRAIARARTASPCSSRTSAIGQGDPGYGRQVRHLRHVQERLCERLAGDENWSSIQWPKDKVYHGTKSTYVRNRRIRRHGHDARRSRDIRSARVLALLGDSVTTDHISPAATSPSRARPRSTSSSRACSRDFNSTVRAPQPRGDERGRSPTSGCATCWLPHEAA